MLLYDTQFHDESSWVSSTNDTMCLISKGLALLLLLLLLLFLTFSALIGCQREKNYFTRWPIPLVVC